MINRVRPQGFGNTLTSSEMSQLDQNAASAIDGRSGESDTAESQVTWSNGGITIGSGAVLTIDPTNFRITSGTASIGAELIGDGSPLKCGISYVDISSASGATYTLSSSEYVNGIIQLTGVITGSVEVILPATDTTTAYQLIIDNESISSSSTNHTVSISVSGGSSTLVLPENKAGMLYVTGTDVRWAALQAQHRIQQVFHKHDSSVYDTDIQEFSTAGYSDVTDYNITFPIVNEDDIFEITYTAGIKRTNSPAAAVGTAVAVVDPQGNVTRLSETVHQTLSTDIVIGRISTIFTAPSSGSYQIKLQAEGKVTNTLKVVAPLSFSIKHIKP